MSIEIVIVGAFLATLLLSIFTRNHPAVVGCLIPIVVGLMMVAWLVIWRSGTSTAVLAVPILVFWAFIGSVPGALIGGWIRTRKGEDFG